MKILRLHVNFHHNTANAYENNSWRLWARIFEWTVGTTHVPSTLIDFWRCARISEWAVDICSCPYNICSFFIMFFAHVWSECLSRHACNTKSLLHTSLAVVLLMYLPVAICGYKVYGINAKDNILESVSPGPMLYTVQVLITLHLFCGFIIVVNPVCQDLEELLRIPKRKFMF